MIVAPPMSWTSALPYPINPKSGPVRKLATLADARGALIYDLPVDKKKARHWLTAGLLVVAASESGASADIHAAAEALVNALDAEGWMSLPPAT
jgi:hypothetical protein